MDMVDIACVCSSQKDIFVRRANYKLSSHYIESAPISSSDHISLASAFSLYMRALEIADTKSVPNFDIRTWCDSNHLDRAALEDVRKQREKLGPFLRHIAKLTESRSSATNTENVRKALAIAFSTQTAIYNAIDDEYRTVPENVAARIDPSSSLLGGNNEWIVYNKLSLGGGHVYLETATAVRAQWLTVRLYRAPSTCLVG